MSVETEVTNPEETKEENITLAETLRKEFEAIVEPPVKEEKNEQGTDKQGTEAEGKSVPTTPVPDKATGGTGDEAKAVQEEPLPTWAKDLKLEDENVVEALNFFDKREAASWTRTPVHLMPADKQEAFKSVQRVYDRHYNEMRKAQEAPKKDIMESINETLSRLQADPRKLRKLEEAKRAIFDEEVEEQKEVSAKSDIDEKLSEAVQSGDMGAIKEAIGQIVSQELSKAAPKIKADVLEHSAKERRELSEREAIEKVRAASARLEEKEGARYKELLVPIDATGENMMVKVAKMLTATGGVDPITGEQVLSNDPDADVENVYRYILAKKQNTGRRIVRTVPTSAQPPSNSTGGEEPVLSDSDFAPGVKWADVARRFIYKKE